MRLIIWGLYIITVFSDVLAVTDEDYANSHLYEAIDDEFPYQVSIQVDGHHTCGGTLISKRHVLTAAHCVYDAIATQMPKERFSIIVGSRFLNGYGGAFKEVDRISRHSDYIPSNQEPAMYADIAVMRLKEEIMDSDRALPIGLPQPNQELADRERLIVSGFGSTVTGSPSSPVLRTVYMYYVTQEDCQNVWTQFNGRITPEHLCADNKRGFGACHGDSGGPLTLENKQVIVGVVSGGTGLGCSIGVPDLFTKVSHYLDYINSELANV